ncbi:MAG: hypothetical protein CVU64_20670 [Deltaproteobacteria bacterium HGW-Deltaproteobacteria-21]|nr:MAG: hypothetical protein CVU64_20670 [Deltaproteobacteria bacterium HGW-Deltaproteobacteria-21]
MHIEIPLERFVDFYRLVALGKLIQGLVHNLNGPLQNLGMDMEMMEHSLRSDNRIPAELSESFAGRLNRMEGEFDHITRLIKSASMRIDPEGDFLQYGTIKAFLVQEISFLYSNLYFKHNVQKDIDLPADLPRLDCFSRDILLSLCWLIQSVVEGMESGEANRFFMTGKSLSSALELSLVVEGTTVGTSYKDTLDEEMDPSGSLQVQDALGMRTLLAILRLYGVSAAFSREPTRFEMTLLIPFRYNPLS